MRAKPFWVLAAMIGILVVNSTSLHASVTCRRVQTLPSPRDAQVVEKIASLARRVAPKEALKIHQIDQRHYVLRPDRTECQQVECFYQLVQMRDGDPSTVFGFFGTGVFLDFGFGLHNDTYEDRYSSIAVESPAGSFITIALPAAKNATLIAADEHAKRFGCTKENCAKRQC